MTRYMDAYAVSMATKHCRQVCVPNKAHCECTLVVCHVIEYVSIIYNSGTGCGYGGRYGRSRGEVVPNKLWRGDVSDLLYEESPIISGWSWITTTECRQLIKICKAHRDGSSVYNRTQGMVTPVSIILIRLGATTGVGWSLPYTWY